jgi:hypothetical protein
MKKIFLLALLFSNYSLTQDQNALNEIKRKLGDRCKELSFNDTTLSGFCLANDNSKKEYTKLDNITIDQLNKVTVTDDGKFVLK